VAKKKRMGLKSKKKKLNKDEIWQKILLKKIAIKKMGPNLKD